MHSTWIRLNAVFFFGVSVLGIAALLSSFTTYFHQSNPVVNRFVFNTLRELKATSHNRRHSSDYTRKVRDIDRADITFDLDCDLSSVFNW